VKKGFVLLLFIGVLTGSFFASGKARAGEWRSKEPLINVQGEYQNVFFHFWVWRFEPLDATVIAVLDYELCPGQIGTYAYRFRIDEFAVGRYQVKMEKQVAHLDEKDRVADAEIIMKGVRPVIDDMHKQFMLYPPRDEEMRAVKRIVNVLYNAGIVIHYKTPF